jgi:hypothetical protein
LFVVASRRQWFLSTAAEQADITAVVRRATPPIIVIAGGELEMTSGPGLQMCGEAHEYGAIDRLKARRPPISGRR